MMKKMMKNEKGFTLIELIIVIAILAIIAAIAIPNILGAVDNSRKSTDVANAKIIANAAAQVMAKDENAAGAIYAIGAALPVTTLTSVGAGADAELAFTTKFFVELNSNMPSPKYKGTIYTETNFYLVVDTNTVQVFVGADADTANDIMLYPTPDVAYIQN